MVDYLSLQGITENPTFATILFTILLSFILSSLIAFTFEKTTRQVLTPIEFLQALILMSIVAATVMQAIGDSLARGLGMLGALAIIRFRTTLKTPRNMIFTFASLAAGIACGVYAWVIGIVGTIGFCSIAFILRFSPLSKINNLTGVLNFELPTTSNDLVALENILSHLCQKFVQVKYRIIQPKMKKLEEVLPEKFIAYEYHLKLRNSTDYIKLDTALSDLETIKGIKLNFENSPENV